MDIDDSNDDVFDKSMIGEESIASEAPEEEEKSLEDCVCLFAGHGQSVFAVECDPEDPRVVCSGGMDDRAFLWCLDADSAECQVLGELAGHTDSVISCRFCPKAAKRRLLATAGMDGRILLWSFADEKASCVVLDGPELTEGVEATGLEWHPSGLYLAASFSDGTAWVWRISFDADDAKASAFCLAIFRHHGESPVTQLSWTCGAGRFLITAAADGSVVVWNPKDGSSVHRLLPICTATDEEEEGEGEAVTAMACHPSSEIHVMLGTSAGRLVLRETPTARDTWIDSPHTGSSIEAIAFSPSSTIALLATGGVDGTVVIWDAARMHRRGVLDHSANDQGVTCFKWLLLGKLQLVTGTTDGTIRRWDALTLKCLDEWHAGLGAVNDLAVSPLVPMVVAAMDDGTAQVFDFALE